MLAGAFGNTTWLWMLYTHGPKPTLPIAREVEARYIAAGHAGGERCGKYRRCLRLRLRHGLAHNTLAHHLSSTIIRHIMGYTPS